MATASPPTLKDVLAAATKLSCQPSATVHDIEEVISMIDQAHHHFVGSITPNVGERGKALSEAEQKRDALKIQLVSIKQGIIGVAARTDGALQFRDYMRMIDDESEGHSRAILTRELQKKAIHKRPDLRKEHLAQGGKRDRTPHASVIGSGA